MRGRREWRREGGDAIFADEIGLNYGVYGEYRLRSACQPIHARRGGLLLPVAIEALIQPHRHGLPVAPEAFNRDLPAGDRVLVGSLSRMLHVHNYPYVDLDGAVLFFRYDPGVHGHVGDALAEIGAMAQDLDDCGLDARMLVCEIAGPAAPDDAALKAVVDEMRRIGFRIAVGDFGAGHSAEARIRLLEPDVVRIDGAWFGELCRHPAAEKLFRPLLSLLHDEGAEVLVDGIGLPAQLRVALDAGADLFQGDLLARPVLTGTQLRAEPLAIDDRVRPPADIIPLFG